MLNKIYGKTKKFIKENYKVLLFYVVLIFLVSYRLPYYVYTGGGVMDTSSKVKIEDSYSVKGKFNFAYVEERAATIPVYLLALINDDWDIEKQSSYKYNDEETYEDLVFRDKLDLEIANSNAIYNAYKLAGKNIQVEEATLYVTYLTEKSDSNLKIGDIILSVDDEEITNLDSIKNIISKKNVGDKVKIVTNKEKEEKYAVVYEENGNKMIGVSISKLEKYNTDPKIELSFNNNESGPSGGLMLSLTIYNQLIENDLTSGLNIVGTGTIDKEGNVGAIGGVKYKLAGAVKNKADIFIVPNEENYDECIKIKEEKNYNIEIIGVSSLQDAVEKLENYNK